ncbi:MAG: hypothetical protein R3F31_02170 [Verrucomicrobiales bacterium]
MIENAADNASVPQALNLLNGPLVEALTNPYSVLGAEVKAAATLEEKTRVIFRSHADSRTDRSRTGTGRG